MKREIKFKAKRKSIFKVGYEIYSCIWNYSTKEKNTVKFKITGLSEVGIYLDGTHIRTMTYFQDGLFYGFGYHSDGHVIHAKKKWHIPFACMFEKLRLLLSHKWAVRLGLETDR